MELVKDLKEGGVNGKTPRKCCGGFPLYVTPEQEQKEGYIYSCLSCNATTAPYETDEEAVQAWNNKILM